MRDVATYPPIEDLLVHKSPMVLVDRFVAWLDDGQGVQCEVDIREDALFADSRGVPSWVGIEYMAQSIGVFSGAHQADAGLPPRIGFLLGSQNITLNCDYFDFGTTVIVEARKSWDGGKLVQFDCLVKSQNTETILIKGCLNCFAPDSNDLQELEHK